MFAKMSLKFVLICLISFNIDCVTKHASIVTKKQTKSKSIKQSD